METQVIYEFERVPNANKFLNTLIDWHIADVKAKLYGNGYMIKVTYEYDESGFDSTCSELDDLADSLGGKEI